MHRTYVIVPIYNEAAVIRPVVESLRSENWGLILVDDGSTDLTWSLINQPGVYRLRHRLNLGQGAAIQTGIAFALRLNAEYLVTFDADGQHDVQDIPALLAPLQAGLADVCLGSRFLPGAATNAGAGRRRTLHFASWINWMLTGVKLTDAHNGLRAFNRKAAAMIRLSQGRMAHATEFLQEIKRHRLRLEEVPVHVHYSEYSQAKGQKLSSGLTILWDLFKRKLFRS